MMWLIGFVVIAAFVIGFGFGRIVRPRVNVHARWSEGCAKACRAGLQQSIPVQAGMLYALKIASEHATGIAAPELAWVHREQIWPKEKTT